MARPHRHNGKAGNKSRHWRNKPSPAIRRMRLLLRLQAMLSYRWAARLLYRMWFTSPKFTEPEREARWREQAEQSLLPHEYGPLAVYRWGRGEKVVLLLHGWSGRGPQMGAFAKPLIEAGYTALSFDAPGHGRTSGKSTNLFRINAALEAVIQHYGPVDSVISHSFGTLVLAYALRHRDLRINKAVCIGSPASARQLVEQFLAALQPNAKTTQHFMQLFAREFGEDIWSRISAEENARGLTTPALIIHDRDDRDVPWQSSQRLAQAWPGAELWYTQGLGHRRILRDPVLLRRVIEFISN